MSDRMGSTIKIFQLVLLAVLAAVGVVVAIGFFQLNLVRLPALLGEVEKVTQILFIWILIILAP